MTVRITNDGFIFLKGGQEVPLQESKAKHIHSHILHFCLWLRGSVNICYTRVTKEMQTFLSQLRNGLSVQPMCQNINRTGVS